MSFEVLQGDCLEIMKDIPSGSIDTCITDPPYGTTACSWDAVIPFAPMWEELKRIVKANGAIVLFGSQPFSSALVMSNPQMFKYEWIWRKNAPTGHLNVKIKPMLNHESVLVFARGRYTYNPQDTVYYGALHRRGGQSENYADYGLENWQEYANYPRTVVDFDVHRSTAQHPTQKPVELMRYLVRTYTNEGDRVLDFTCGSGTTGVACAIERRDCVLIDNDAGYCSEAVARIKRANGIACDVPKRIRGYAPMPLFESVA